MNRFNIRFAGMMILLTVFAVSGKAAANHHTLTAGPGEDSTVMFISTEMGCKEDCKLVEKALYRKKGVRKVLISGDTIRVTFAHAKVSSRELAAVIEQTGTCEDPDARVHKVFIKPD